MLVSLYTANAVAGNLSELTYGVEMLQIGTSAGPVGSIRQLLPGDQAPSLKLDRVFNRREQVNEIVLDRLSVIILWNAGCAGCLPLVEEIATFAEPLDIPCYAIAILVRDVEATAEAAKDLNTTALLALEAPAVQSIGLSRGWVTRQWAEASGQPGVPAAFIVNDAGIVTWMGYPSEIKTVLPEIRSECWDVDLARQKWAEAVNSEDFMRQQFIREITDAAVAGETMLAGHIIEDAERQLPGIVQDKQFNILKLETLADTPNKEADALSYYQLAAARFHDDEAVLISLSDRVVRKLHENKAALQTVLDRLGDLDRRRQGDPEQGLIPLSRKLLTAETLALSGATAEAQRRLESISQLVDAIDLAPRLRDWAITEIARISDRIEAGCRP